ncbi:hypothetical protein PENSPDRAFT_605223 [Peniophora sp. CONT]|nr:hypothetical protein PENSPDRAFT_605223 [Peniophora sp. CONT]
MYSRLWWLSIWAAHLVSGKRQLLPEDPDAFPKYSVLFHNGYPVVNETAQKWLRDGLRGGEYEFLGQPWADPGVSQRPEIGDGQADLGAVSPAPAGYKLELMRLGSKDSYLCLVPPPPEYQSTPPQEEEPTELTALHSWSLLQPLAGSCIYHRQGWFTYAYCHNSHVRQFHETRQQRPNMAGGYQIEEDTEWEAYDLGRAPKTTSSTEDVAVVEQAALAANVELARGGAGSRYLVQRWRDGTTCDKTGRGREIEVQFHCSMTMTDTILFVKETKTCSYVLVINTPRLCGEPGFKSRLDLREETPIRCRHVVDEAGMKSADPNMPISDSPYAIPRPRAPIIEPPPILKTDPDVESATAALTKAVQLALDRMVHKAGFDSANELPGTVLIEDAGDGEMLIEFLSAAELNQPLELDLDIEYDGVERDNGEAVLPDSERLAAALRAAGFNVQSVNEQGGYEDEYEDEQASDGQAKGRSVRDEL